MVDIVQKLNAVAVGYSLAILSGLSMLLFGIFGNLGWYMGAVDAMTQWHVFFDLSFWGIIAGIIEASIWGFVAGWLAVYFYNMFA